MFLQKAAKNQDQSIEESAHEKTFAELTPKARGAAYGRFRRSSSRADTPEEIKDVIKSFNNNNNNNNKSRASLTQLFKQWFVAGGDWKSTLVREQYLRETSTTNRELDVWMTIGQVKKHCGGDDEAEELAAELTKRKRALGLFRRHPDMPDIEKATLFWVMKEMDQ